MINTKKIITIILSLILVVTIAGCSAVPISLTHEWAYKTEKKELAIGVYIYSLYSAYTQAQKYAETVDGYDEKKSFLHLEITDDDGQTAKAEDWIYQQADLITKSILAVDNEFTARELTSSPDEITSAKENAKEEWDLGPYASFYAQMGYASTPYKSIFEPYGISYDSYYESVYATGIQQTALFKSIYDVDGTDAVSDADLQKFFEESYTNYSFFNVSLTTSGTDEDGEATSVAMSADEKAKVKKDLDAYAKSINEKGTSFEDVTKQYMSSYSVTSDPSKNNVEVLADSSTDASVVAAVEKLKDGQATVVETGEGTSAAYYLVYKGKIADKITEYIETESNRYTVLTKMKTEEFADYVKELAGKLVCDKNEGAINKYKASMFEDFSDATADEG